MLAFMMLLTKVRRFLNLDVAIGLDFDPYGHSRKRHIRIQYFSSVVSVLEHRRFFHDL